MTEFEIIQHYFAKQIHQRTDINRGIGDDAAIVTPPTHHTLAITTDTLVANHHFFEKTDPLYIGHKALAVNLSDLAAMGATPAWMTLALTLPNTDKAWLQAFCRGLFKLAKQHQVALIGGNLARGPLSITIQALGFLPKNRALLRSGAKPGDLIYVTGTLGDAGLALQYLQKKISIPTRYQKTLLKRLYCPEPRIDCGQRILTLATAAIDVSDGLASDLGHILEASNTNATLYVDQLPRSQMMKQIVSSEKAISLALTAGDDYELCFTIPPGKRKQLEKALRTLDCRYTCIGEMTACHPANALSAPIYPVVARSVFYDEAIQQAATAT